MHINSRRTPGEFSTRLSEDTCHALTMRKRASECHQCVPEIHHLVQKFVDDNKVVAYALFFQLFEIFVEYLGGA
jgi:hypothetical protein